MAELVTKPDLQALRSDLLLVKSELQAAIDSQTLRLTVRMGGIMVAGMGVVVASIGVLAFFLRLN
ncbi:hypothetical protein BH11PSE4_BH11PSE4_40300 [soil metagenome]